MSAELEEKLREAEAEIARLQSALADRENYIRSTFSRYLTDEVLEEIMASGDLRIGGERRAVSIMFADVRHSTQLSEEMDPVSFLLMLNHFLEEMIEIVNSWQGNILDFVGDAIVAVFGAPRENEFSARDALACAVAMQRRMPAVNEWNRSNGYPKISIGIGLHKGEAIVGNIGSQTRTKYDMIGRSVNLASRIQDYAGGGHILVSAELLEAAGDQVRLNEAASMTVRPKGIQSDIPLYDVIGFGKQSVPEEAQHDR